SSRPGNPEIYIGRPSYIADQLPPKLQAALIERTTEIEDLGELLAVLIIGSSSFIFRFRDTPRAHIGDMLQAIKKRGMELVMLTGDHYNSAKRTADELQINEFHAGLTPEGKLDYVSNLAEKKGLAMIGDGVNDAPALARATVGISMGKVGSSAAIEAADVVLLHDNIELLDWLLEKAKQTKVVVKQNLFLATAAIFIASLPALAGIVPLWLAVVMHEGGTVLVGLNALRLLKTK
ncbi:MAG TPA: HAD-IC family P-type ATPase, partial [Parachlamydiaceae bacterium]|nr:HAD-IC family P-type ATPase [Parachlamydiaceae bacterium]